MREMKIFWFYSLLLRVFGSFLISAVTVAVIEPATTHTTCNQSNTWLRYFRNHANFWTWFALANLNLGWKSWRLSTRMISLKLRFSTRLHGHISSFQWIVNGTTHHIFQINVAVRQFYGKLETYLANAQVILDDGAISHKNQRYRKICYFLFLSNLLIFASTPIAFWLPLQGNDGIQ